MVESPFPFWNATNTEINSQWVTKWLKVDCVECKLNPASPQVNGMSGAKMIYLELKLASGETLSIVVKENHS